MGLHDGAQAIGFCARVPALLTQGLVGFGGKFKVL